MRSSDIISALSSCGEDFGSVAVPYIHYMPYRSCPLAPSKAKFSSIESFFSACIGLVERRKTIGHSKTDKVLARGRFCSECKQYEASKKGKLLLDLSEHNIKIDSSMLLGAEEKYVKEK